MHQIGINFLKPFGYFLEGRGDIRVCFFEVRSWRLCPKLFAEIAYTLGVTLQGINVYSREDKITPMVGINRIIYKLYYECIML